MWIAMASLQNKIHSETRSYRLWKGDSIIPNPLRLSQAACELVNKHHEQNGPRWVPVGTARGSGWAVSAHLLPPARGTSVIGLVFAHPNNSAGLTDDCLKTSEAGGKVLAAILHRSRCFSSVLAFLTTSIFISASAKSVLLSHFCMAASKLAFATQIGSCVPNTDASAPDRIPGEIQRQLLLTKLVLPTLVLSWKKRYRNL